MDSDDFDMDGPPDGILGMPAGGQIVVQRIPFGDDDEHQEDDEGGIPPEILEMIRVTEAMHARSLGGLMTGGPFGQHPRQLGGIQKEEKDDSQSRFEESH